MQTQVNWFPVYFLPPLVPEDNLFQGYRELPTKPQLKQVTYWLSQFSGERQTWGPIYKMSYDNLTTILR